MVSGRLRESWKKRGDRAACLIVGYFGGKVVNESWCCWRKFSRLATGICSLDFVGFIFIINLVKFIKQGKNNAILLELILA